MPLKSTTPPLIGLTCSSPSSDDNRSHGWHTPLEYIHAIVRAGGLPVMIPAESIEQAPFYAQCLSGIILVGGGDIEPSFHTDQDHHTLYNINPQRDRFELALAHAILKSKIPTLAICRGLQIINTALGGRLHLHIPDIWGEETLHRAPPRQPTRHPINIAPDSRLAKIMGSNQIDSVSWHHQAVDRLANEMVAVAWSPDGVVEAIEYKEHPELIAVQWHPELSAHEDPSQQKLFDDLVHQALIYQQRTLD